MAFWNKTNEWWTIPENKETFNEMQAIVDEMVPLLKKINYYAVRASPYISFYKGATKTLDPGTFGTVINFIHEAEKDFALATELYPELNKLAKKLDELEKAKLKLYPWHAFRKWNMQPRTGI